MIDSDNRQLKHISPDSIKRNPDNPRIFFRPKEMEKLLISISEYGIQVPLTVYKDSDSFVLIDGERRWRCAQKLNFKKVPALIQDKPSPLENLLLMYNIHALREQWDYFTIASKLKTVIELFESERGKKPNEIELSLETGLTRGQIRRCNLLLDLPDRYQELLMEELQHPKGRQRLSEDFFLEMERSLKTVTKRFPEFMSDLDDVRDALIDKYKTGVINAVTDFRQLSKIATSIDNFEINEDKTKNALVKIFNDKKTGIVEVFTSSFQFQYEEKVALRNIENLNEFLSTIVETRSPDQFDSEFRLQLQQLYNKLNTILGG